MTGSAAGRGWTPKGQAVLLIVIQDQHGSGFSLQTIDQTVLEGLPAILRNVADSIEQGQE